MMMMMMMLSTGVVIYFQMYVTKGSADIFQNVCHQSECICMLLTRAAIFPNVCYQHKYRYIPKIYATNTNRDISNECHQSECRYISKCMLSKRVQIYHQMYGIRASADIFLNICHKSECRNISKCMSSE